MNNVKVLIFPIVLVLAVIVLWFYSMPLYREGMKTISKDKPKLETNIQKERELQERVKKLSGDIIKNEEDTADTFYAIPTSKEAKSYISQLENLSAREGMTIRTLRVEGDENRSLSRNISVEQSSISKSKGAIELVGSYGQFKQFLQSLAKLERLNNVESISVNNDVDDENIVSGKYILGFEIYWLPELTASDLQFNLGNTIENGNN